MVITSDVIVGFPGETAEDFEQTMTLIDQVRFDALFTFIFSPREGTPAAKMDDPISKEEKAAHFQRLVERQDQISEEKHRAYIGKTVRCLVDGKDDKGLTARTPGNRLVRLTGDDRLIGQFVDVKITGANKWSPQRNSARSVRSPCSRLQSVRRSSWPLASGPRLAASQSAARSAIRPAF